VALLCLPYRAPRPRFAWLEWLSQLTVIALALITIGWLAGLVQQHSAYPFDSDEGVHAYEALRVSAHLRDGDVAGAVGDYLAPILLPAGSPLAARYGVITRERDAYHARLFSLVLYTLDVLLLYALGAGWHAVRAFPWLAGV